MIGLSKKKWVIEVGGQSPPHHVIPLERGLMKIALHYAFFKKHPKTLYNSAMVTVESPQVENATIYLPNKDTFNQICIYNTDSTNNVFIDMSEKKIFTL